MDKQRQTMANLEGGKFLAQGGNGRVFVPPFGKLPEGADPLQFVGKVQTMSLCNEEYESALTFALVSHEFGVYPIRRPTPLRFDRTFDDSDDPDKKSWFTNEYERPKEPLGELIYPLATATFSDTRLRANDVNHPTAYKAIDLGASTFDAAVANEAKFAACLGRGIWQKFGLQDATYDSANALHDLSDRHCIDCNSYAKLAAVLQSLLEDAQHSFPVEAAAAASDWVPSAPIPKPKQKPRPKKLPRLKRKSPKSKSESKHASPKPNPKSRAPASSKTNPKNT